MKKLIFILLAVGLPLGVATLANPAGLSLAGWPAMTALALGAKCGLRGLILVGKGTLWWGFSPYKSCINSVDNPTPYKPSLTRSKNVLLLILLKLITLVHVQKCC